MAEERLQKVLAAAGIASRRACEEMISAGRVRVNGEVVTRLGTKVDPKSASIAVDGKPVGVAQSNIYYRVYKPRGLLSDIGGDSRGRRTVAELLPPGVGRVFPVGRLDLNSEGLVLLTDDGELAHRLTHPRFEHPKTYFVLSAQRPAADALFRLRNGIELESGRTAPARVEVAEDSPPVSCWTEAGWSKGRLVRKAGGARALIRVFGCVLCCGKARNGRSGTWRPRSAFRCGG